ncbi:MAG TPA: fibronectin type III domain-containing protein [Kofleriaceae bacterium]|nr:fibronectin type III domain-containing protein [Kofleriaceae bacterium]
MQPIRGAVGLACAFAAAAGCTDVDRDEPPSPESPPVIAQAASLSPLRTRARAVDDYLVNYGSWDAGEIAVAQRHQLVILNPNRPDLTRAQVAAIQGGTDPNDPSRRVIVVCYVSIGEDVRTAGHTDAQLAADPRFRGDGTGPRMDPRGPDADGQPLTGIDPLGAPSNGGTGFASFYLDDVSVHESSDHVGDGLPDRNGNFDGYFTNVGDPAWFAALEEMTYATDHAVGFREALTTTYGRGLGCDGVFLDTIDTMAPNAWTSSASSNESKFEWTAPGYSAFLERLRAAYPDIVVVHNRGLFFFNPQNPHYAFIPRGDLDFVMFESYRLNSGSTDNPDPYFYPDNRYDFAPKLLAEAGRADGFRVLSLGYAEGPPDQMSEATLTGGSTLGHDSLLEDIRVTERLAGFRHYLTDRSVTLVNSFVLEHADRSDTEPPVWTSTYNDHAHYPDIPGEPTPRVGIQQVVPGAGSLTVRWDLALDLNRVGYAVYYQTSPFDFAADPLLTGATRVVVTPQPTAAYARGVGPGSYASEATISNLVPGQPYYLAVRAFDDAPTVHEDANQVSLSAAPDGAPPYLGRLRAWNGPGHLGYRAVYDQSWTWRRVYIDRDRVAGTGWSAYGIGADLLIEEQSVYRYTGNGTSWSWTYAGSVARTSGADDGRSYVQWDLDPSVVDAAGGATRLVFQLQRSGAVVTSAPYDHVYTSSDPASPYLSMYVENDAVQVDVHAEIGPPFTYRHVFVDEDANASTGYAIGGVGADAMIENGNLYRWVGPGWAWTRIGSANEVVSGSAHDWSMARADLGASAGTPRFDVVFQANGGSPTYVAPVYVHAFTP